MWRVSDHGSCEGKVSLQEEMHFIGGVLILLAGLWTALEAVRNEDFGKGNALALKPKNCVSVITSCAIVYESADCASGWKLPINEVPFFKPTIESVCSTLGIWADWQLSQRLVYSI